jgi:RHS repeat-associated protein
MVSKTSTADEPRLNLGVMQYGENGSGPHSLTSTDAESFAYDANGNQLGEQNSVYVWNHRDLLVAVSNDELESSYDYGADRRRVRQIVRTGNAITRVLYPSEFAELRGDHLIFYIFNNQQRIAQVKIPFDPATLLKGFSNTASFPLSAFPTHWYLSDHLAGTHLLLDAAGQEIAEVAYYPFGLTRYEDSTVETHYRFTGQEEDVTHLYYYRARYYNPRLGRFISVDPLYAREPDRSLSEPQLLNLYAYVLNNPIGNTDPSGEEVKIIREHTPFERSPNVSTKQDLTKSGGATIGKDLRVTVDKYELGLEANSPNGIIHFRELNTLRGLSAEAKATLRADDISLGISAEAVTVEVNVKTCLSVLCLEAGLKVGPQLTLKGELGTKNTIQIGAGLKGGKLGISYDHSRLQATKDAFYKMFERPARAIAEMEHAMKNGWVPFSR